MNKVNSAGNPTAPWLRLRQIALIAPSLPILEAQFIDILGVNVCHRDPEVAKFGLINVLFPFGNQFLEIVAPTTQESAGARQLARQGGAGGYMVITQCREHAPYRVRANQLGMRVVHEFEQPDFIHMQLHPRDTGGTFLEIDEQRGDRAHDIDGPWMPAGADWQRQGGNLQVQAITAAEITCSAPQEVAQRWAAITGCPVVEQEIGTPTNVKLGTPTIQLENAELRFVQSDEARPDNLTGIEIKVRDREKILSAAAKHHAVSAPNQLHLAGIRISLR